MKRRKKEFKEGNPSFEKRKTDGRFGHRGKTTSEESSSIFTYSRPGKGQNGEHQN
jgi:hypothetical protein